MTIFFCEFKSTSKSRKENHYTTHMILKIKQKGKEKKQNEEEEIKVILTSIFLAKHHLSWTVPWRGILCKLRQTTTRISNQTTSSSLSSPGFVSLFLLLFPQAQLSFYVKTHDSKLVQVLYIATFEKIHKLELRKLYFHGIYL